MAAVKTQQTWIFRREVAAHVKIVELIVT